MIPAHSLSPRLRRTLALSLLIALIGFAHGAIVAPLVERFARQDEALERSRALLVRYRGLAAARPALAARHAQLERRLSAQAGFLAGSSDALVAARLQDRLKAVVEQSGGELRSTQSLAGRDEGRFRRITIRALIGAEINALLKTLHALESEGPAIFVDNLDIRARSTHPGDHAAEGRIVLDVRLDLFGYTRGTKR